MTIYTDKPGQWMMLQNLSWDDYSRTLAALRDWIRTTHPSTSI